MNRFVLALVLCGLAAAAVPAAAQVAPQPQNTSYNDPAMSFTAPAGYRGAARPYNPDDIGQATVIATFVKNPGKPEMRVIQIQLEQYDGSLSGYTTLAENELRGQLDGVFVTKKQSALSNGMPAMWEEISVGSGFQEMKRWEYLWVDGFRGVVVSITGRYGELTEAQAKEDLASASGVRYPRYRE